LLTAGAVSALVLVPKAWIAVAALLAAAVVLYLVLATLDGRVEVPLLFWVMAFPLGYYFLTFPRERGIITLDRITVGALLVAMCLATGPKATKLPDVLRRSAVVWGCFVLVAFVCVGKATDVLSSARTVLDGFFLPVILGWCVFRNFDVRRNLVTLHTMVCVMAIYVAAIGAAEMATGTDIMPLPGVGLYFAGSVLRPNGPFATDNSFALIGLISFFFLLFLRRAIGKQMLWWHRLLHTAGAASALATALMPLFRSVAITLAIIFLLDMCFKRRVDKAIASLTIFLSVVGVLAIFSAKAPDAYQDRLDGGNFYSRIAEQRQTLELFKMHPFTGVGILNFFNVAQAQSRSVAVYKGFESVDAPHNNLGAILAETGLMGFVPYVAAQVLLIIAFRKLASGETPQSRAVWISFLYVFLSYWVSGLSLTSGYYSDLNLWYIFVQMVLYKYAITETRPFCIQRAPELTTCCVDAMHLLQPSS
jgi:O-antigen ligase